MITVTVEQTIPSSGNAPGSPIRLWNIHSRFPLLEFLLPHVHGDILPYKLRDPTSIRQFEVSISTLDASWVTRQVLEVVSKAKQIPYSQNMSFDPGRIWY